MHWIYLTWSLSSSTNKQTIYYFPVFFPHFFKENFYFLLRSTAFFIYRHSLFYDQKQKIPKQKLSIFFEWIMLNNKKFSFIFTPWMRPSSCVLAFRVTETKQRKVLPGIFFFVFFFFLKKVMQHNSPTAPFFFRMNFFLQHKAVSGRYSIIFLVIYHI